EDWQRAQPTQLPRNQQTDAATKHIAHRIEDRVAVIAERGRRFAIAIDDGVGILKNFPEAFENHRNNQSPTRREVSLDDEPGEQQQQSREHEAVEQMREAVRIEKELGCL